MPKEGLPGRGAGTIHDEWCRCRACKPPLAVRTAPARRDAGPAHPHAFFDGLTVGFVSSVLVALIAVVLL